MLRDGWEGYFPEERHPGWVPLFREVTRPRTGSGPTKPTMRHIDIIESRMVVSGSRISEAGLEELEGSRGGGA